MTLTKVQQEYLYTDNGTLKTHEKCPGCVDGKVLDNWDNFPPECGACFGTGKLTKDRLIELYCHNPNKNIDEFLEHLKSATKIVETWPKYKQEALNG